MRNTRLYWLTLGTVLLIGAPQLSARGSSKSAPPAPDQIAVIAHIAVSGGPVTRLTTGTHWRKNYLYLDHAPAGPVTILDVTDPAALSVAGEMDVPIKELDRSLSTVAGTAALVVSSPVPVQTVPQTLTVLSFADPEHPNIMRQFTGVTAMLKDNSRQLIYLVNADGVWVLRVEPAADKELEKQYADYVIYNR